MAMSLHALAIGTFVPMLRSLSAILDKAEAQPQERKLDATALPNARLAPDMYPLTMQVALACDHANEAMRHLAGIPPPTLAEHGVTLEDLEARIDATVAHVGNVSVSAFAGADGKTIEFPLSGAPGVFRMTGEQFLRDWALPHFYFHVVTAYDILRHSGLAIGKQDYLSHVGVYIHPS
jgi:hypothetical protein